jgi:membrane-associated phospholipid phosphatase
LRAALASILTCACIAGCATLPDGRRWGDDVTIAPGWDRVRDAAARSARDPWVWAPLAGAAGLQVGSWDRKISRWAMRETPIFGSQAHATTWSDDLRSVAVVADAATVLLTPSGEDAASWLQDKAKGYAVDLTAASAAIGTTRLLKTAAGRTRPSGADNESFPSGHVSIAATYDRLAARNLEYIDLTPFARQGLVYGLDALTLGTAWARVEAGAHYPSDTLVSIALGNFSANFFKNAFMGAASERQQQVAVVPSHGGFMLHWQLSF